MPSSAPCARQASSSCSIFAQHLSPARRASPRTSSPPILQKPGSAIGTCADSAPRSAGARRRAAGTVESFERIFLEHMEEPEALLDLGEAIALAQAQPICLLCLERDPEHCHRMIVADRMVEQTGQELKHLFVQLDEAQPGFI